mmetsp:Transcript_14783/g.34089  ORF Transcript_14783/g.34089 Transcript_14783/m.34089 type:complete len:208 (+) Transcript_14783:5068-5691(+)
MTFARFLRVATFSPRSQHTSRRCRATAASKWLLMRSSRRSPCRQAPLRPLHCASPPCTTAPRPPGRPTGPTPSTTACLLASPTSCTPSPFPTWSGPPPCTAAGWGSTTPRRRSQRPGSGCGGAKITYLTARRNRMNRSRRWRLTRTASQRETAGRGWPTVAALSTTSRRTAGQCGRPRAGCSVSATLQTSTSTASPPSPRRRTRWRP